MVSSLNTTVAGINANSYNSLAEANTYFADDANFDDTWDAMTDDEKSQRLIASTMAIDRYEFKGHKYLDDKYGADEQALEFPRLEDYYTDIIPKRVKKAQLEMLKVLYINQSSDGDNSNKNKIVSASVSGVVSVSFHPYVTSDVEDMSMVTGASTEAIKALLRPWLIDSRSGPFPFEK